MHGTNSPFFARVTEALRAHGWRLSGDEPVVTLPCPATFVRPLGNGWVVTLMVTWSRRDQIELSPWERGMNEVVDVESAATFSPAEMLAAHLGRTPGFGVDVAPPFQASGERESLRQLRGPEDHARVVEEIVSYAQDILLPAAAVPIPFDRWMADFEEIGREWPDVLAWDVPVMLVAHGRRAEAIELLQAARRDPELATVEFEAFADRVEAFVRAGAPLPTDGDALAAIAAERDERIAATLAENAARLADVRRDLRAATAKLGVAMSAAGIQALWRLRPGDEGAV